MPSGRRSWGRTRCARWNDQVVLSIIDNKWREHLSEMDYLRAGIGLRAMGQRDPLRVPARGVRHVHRDGRLGEA